MTWLQGRGDIAYRSQKPLRLRGDVTVAPDGFAIDAMKAEIDGGAVEGRVAVSHREADRGSKISAELKAERLDLDAATAFARSLAGPQAEWPDEGHLVLDIGRAISSRPGTAAAGGQARLRPESVLARPVEYRSARQGHPGRHRPFRSRRVAREAGAQLDGAVACPAHRPDCAVCAIAGRAAQCDGRESGTCARQTHARSRQECRAGRSRQCARGARYRRAAAQGRHHDHREAACCGDPRHRPPGARTQRTRHRVEDIVKSGPRLAGAARARSHHCGRRGPGAVRGHGERCVGCARCG